MLNLYKLIEIFVSLQLLIVSTFIPIYIQFPLIDKSVFSFELPLSLQIPTIIFLTLLFEKKVTFRAFTIYIFIGLFISPVFHQGGSLGYLLTPNFGYLLGTYPLIKIVDNSNLNNKINVKRLLINGFMGITAMHLTGILYNFIQIVYYNQFDVFIYNLGKYSIGKIGYHFIMLIPLLLLIKPINYYKYHK